MQERKNESERENNIYMRHWYWIDDGIWTWFQVHSAHIHAKSMALNSKNVRCQTNWIFHRSRRRSVVPLTTFADADGGRTHVRSHGLNRMDNIRTCTSDRYCRPYVPHKMGSIRCRVISPSAFCAMRENRVGFFFFGHQRAATAATDWRSHKLIINLAQTFDLCLSEMRKSEFHSRIFSLHCIGCPVQF